MNFSNLVISMRSSLNTHMKTKTMDWTLVILFATFGIVMGALSVKGFTQKLEPFLWILFGIIISLVISRNIDHRVFLHGLIIGISWGVFNGLIQSAFFDSYMANNPSVTKDFGKVTFMQPRYFVILTGPVIGAITGCVIGGLSLLLKKLW